jgi:polysaccharide export outer membrane protein
MLSAVLFCALLSLVTSCHSPASAPEAAWANLPAQSVTNSFNRLQEGDEIQIAFEGATNLNTIQKVSADGLITMPFVGRVKAVGKTPLELETLLKVLFEPQVKTTEISVKVVASAAAVYVVGAILKPGRVPMDRPLTALDAIMEAGGFDPSRAKLTEVAVLRIENGQRVKFRFNLKRALQGQDTSLFYLKPFDIVYVPEKTFNF